MNYKSKLKFSEAMLRFGLIPPNNIIADGKVHLCKYDKDGLSSESGWYLFSNKPSTGLYGCFDINKRRIWSSKKIDVMDKDARLNYLKRIYKLRTVLHKYKIANGLKENSDLSETKVDIKNKYISKVLSYVIKNCQLKYTKPRCKYCHLVDCRYQMANNIFDIYGINTFYRVETSQLGITMGLSDPGKKYSKDNIDLKDKYTKEIGQIKSQFGRWKKKPPTPKNVTP